MKDSSRKTESWVHVQGFIGADSIRSEMHCFGVGSWGEGCRHSCLPQVKLLFCASIITTNHGDTLLFYTSFTTMILINLVTKLLRMLLSTATETVVTTGSDRIVRTWHLTPSTSCLVTAVIVKLAHDHSVLCGLAFLAVDWNLCVTVAVSSLGANLSTTLPVSGVSCHHRVSAATSSSWSSATSAGSSSRHVKRLPRQVVGRVLIITCVKKVVGQAAIAVEHGEARRFTCFCQFCF